VGLALVVIHGFHVGHGCSAGQPVEIPLLRTDSLPLQESSWFLQRFNLERLILSQPTPEQFDPALPTENCDRAAWN
jgi:hypothetical protein